MIKRDLQIKVGEVAKLLRATVAAIEATPAPTERELGELDQAKHTLSLLALAGLVKAEEETR